MNFSRAKSIQDALNTKQRRCRTLAKLAPKEFKTKHPDWCRDAAKGDFTMMDKKVKEDCLKAQKKVSDLREKLHAKD